MSYLYSTVYRAGSTFLSLTPLLPSLPKYREIASINFAQHYQRDCWSPSESLLRVLSELRTGGRY